MEPAGKKRFVIRLNIHGRKVDLPGLWGIAALIFLAGVLIGLLVLIAKVV